MNKIQKLALTTGVLLTSGAAFAEDTGVSTAITSAVDSFKSDALLAISVIGGATIAVGAVALTFKWAKASLFS